MAAMESEVSDDEAMIIDEIQFSTRENESSVQDERVRRDIRRKYRTLNQETQAKMDNLADSGPLEVFELIERGNTLFSQVTKTREAAMDSQQMHLCAQMLKRNAESLSANLSEFKPLEFAEKLVSHLGNRMESMDDENGSVDLIPSENWIEFGREVLPMFKKAPSFHFMYGSFETNQVPPERKRRTRAKDDEVAKAVVPKQVAEITKGEQETTTEEVQKVLGIMHYVYINHFNREPICYFQFVTDPHSFGHTAENIFHLSFLIKDGLAGIKLDEHGLPVIWPLDEKEQRECKNKEASQFIMTLTMNEWREITDAFRITNAIIPPRSN